MEDKTDPTKPYPATGKHCLVCCRPDLEKPSIFRGTPWCSDDHRKVVVGERQATQHEFITMDETLYLKLKGVVK